MKKQPAKSGNSNGKQATKPTAKVRLKVISSRLAFRGKVFEVTVEEVQEPNGVRARRDTVRHQGSVVIMPIDDSGSEPRVLLERQYRYPAGDYLWEFPAGRIDPGEEELAGAKRELLEETGYTARKWKRALFYYASPGFLSETMAVYLARGLTPGKAQPDPDEVISHRFFPLSALLRKARNGKLRDGKTISGVLWLGTALGGEGERK